jgi:hypothetical protein
MRIAYAFDFHLEIDRIRTPIIGMPNKKSLISPRLQKEQHLEQLENLV